MNTDWSIIINKTDDKPLTITEAYIAKQNAWRHLQFVSKPIGEVVDRTERQQAARIAYNKACKAYETMTK